MNEDALEKLRERFEQMLAAGEKYFFEADELECLANYYEQDMEFEKALQVISYGLSIYPNYDTLLMCKVHYLIVKGQIIEAQELLSTIVTRDVEYYLSLGEIELFNENDMSALAAFKSIIELSESTIEDCIDILDICVDFDRVDLLSHLTPLIETRYEDFIPYLRELAILYEDRDECEQAILIYNKILDINSFSYDDWFSLAKVHARLNEYDKALEACDFALAIKENDDIVVSFKGYCLYDCERFEEAIEQFKIFLDLTADKVVAYELIGEAYSRMEQHENAIKYLLQAAAIDEQNSDIYYQLAVNYYNMGNIDSAIKNLRQAVFYNEADREARIFLGELLLQKGDFVDAYKQLMCIDKHPITDTVEAIAYADVCIQLQRYEEALDVLEQLVEKEPYNLQFLFDMVLCYMQVGEYDKASDRVEHIEKLSHDIELINSFDDISRKEWVSVGERIEQLRNILKVYIDEQL